MATKAQEWARKRNSTKWFLAGVQSVINNILYYNGMITSSEAERLLDALNIIKDVLDNWKSKNGISKSAYLRKQK